VVGELQKTATGKIQKFALREYASRLDETVRAEPVACIDDGDEVRRSW
jgi:acyl-coenzyme A synthetase/AMP-(fatty) acid ligase